MRLQALQVKDLTHVVEQLFLRDRGRRSFLVAVQGTGEAGLLRTQVGEFVVVPVGSEVELRRAMPPLDLDPGEAGALRRVFLVPWDRLPLDLSGRFAGHGRVQMLPRVSLLQTRLRVGEVDPRVLECPLAGYLMGREVEMDVSSMGRLTEQILWQEWLRVEWRTPGDLNAPELLVWAATDGGGGRFVAAMGAPEAAGVRAALMGFLRQQVGILGAVAWAAWERGRGAEVLAFGVLCEGLGATEDAGGQMLLKAAGRVMLGGADPKAVAEQLQGRVALAMATLERCDERAAGEVLRAAEAMVREHAVPGVRALLAGSPRLETSWNLRLEALGEALLAVVKRRDPAGLGAVSERMRDLVAHERMKKPDAAAVARQAEMGARLAAWLLERSDRRAVETPSSYAAVEALGSWYTREGGFLDWARRSARAAAGRSGRLGEAITAVLQEADEARRALDLRFARALVDWYAAGRPASAVVPIERAVDRFVVEFLKESEERRLLVLLVDGMAWAQAVELLESLGERATPWAPISWRSPVPPVLAAAPTLTNVSRTAFFAGKVMPAGQVHETGEDPRRWQKHAGLRKLLPGAVAPRLYLGGEGHLRDGSLDPRVREQIERHEERVVALVLNAIDESLKGEPQVEHAWTVESIRSLPDLLAAARTSKRAVVLASDHGHVAGDLQVKVERRGEEKGGGRWRPLDASGFDPDFEVALKSEGAWRPRGSDGVVLLADDQHSYHARRTWGDHGGATLAEVVAPLLMIGWEGMGRECAEPGSDEESALGIAALRRPRWWHLETEGASGASGRGRGSRAKSRTPAEGVMVLPGIVTEAGGKAREGAQAHVAGAHEGGAQAGGAHEKGASGRKSAAKGSPSASGHALSTETQALAKSEVFKALAGESKYREQVLAAVDYLASRGGLAPIRAFGDALGIAEWRVPQTVSRFAELLNADGEAVLGYDLKGGQVVLDLGRLRGGFGIARG
ncbi:MAG: BREX-2 system phosphatase PglZ [Candidatus Eisenbacteria bacterium]|nr:BREX-2 system phosphatase PglZ [Candidatus Eisenbacteria bacterium]